MFKKILAIVLSLMLVLSFAACKKNNTDGASSLDVDSNPTQDYDNGEWDEGEELTDEEKEEIEDLWNDIVNNGGAEIVGGDSSTGSDAQSSQSDSSSNSSKDSSSSSQSSQASGSSSNSQSSSSSNSSQESSSSSQSSSSSVEQTSSDNSSSQELSGTIVSGNTPGIW